MKLARFRRPELNDWSAFDHLNTLRHEINRFFEPVIDRDSSDVFNTWAPAIDLYEDQESLVLTAELPGLKKEDIEINVHENTVTVSGERKSIPVPEGARSSRTERFVGRFQRTLSLPKQVDSNAVKATYRDGLLRVTLPKSPEAKPRQIQVENN